MSEPTIAERRIAARHLRGIVSSIEDMFDSGDEPTQAYDKALMRTLEKLARWLADGGRKPAAHALQLAASMLEERAVEVRRWEPPDPWETRDEPAVEAAALETVARFLAPQGTP
jgi:hypothetical protein